MDQYEWVRTAHRVYKKSIRQIARETGHTRRTVRKVLAGQDPKYRREKEPACPVMDPVAGIVEGWLRADREQLAKQRHTAHRVWRRLVDEHGFTGAEPTVRRWVRERKMRLGWHRPGAVVPLDPEQALEAEVDWGTAWVRMKGEDVQVKLFCMRSRYSGKSFVRAYPRERQEMFLDGHIRAFDWYGGVFPTVVFDNLKTAVRRILRGKARIEQDRFTALRAHYTFESRFCNPARGQEKGGVEGLVGFARRNCLVPVPEVADFEELNAQLLERCATDDQRRIGGRSDARTIGNGMPPSPSGCWHCPRRHSKTRRWWACGSAGTRPPRWIRTGTRCRPRMWDVGSGPISAVTGCAFTRIRRRWPNMPAPSVIATGGSIRCTTWS